MKFFAKPNGFPLVALLCALVVAAPSAHADFWVGNSTANTLQYFDTSTNAITQTIDFNVYGTGNHTPGGIALDSNHNLWVADTIGNTLAEYTYNSNTGLWNKGTDGKPIFDTPITNGAGSPEGIAIYNGSVYVVERGTGNNQSVMQYNIASKSWTTPIPTSAFPSGAYSYPQGIAINSSGNLFVTDGSSSIYEFSKSSNSWSLTNTLNGGGYAYGLAFDSKGNLFAASQNDGAILEYANTNGTYSISPTTVVSGADTPVGLAFDPTTGYLLDAENGGSYNHEVVAYSLSGSSSAATGTYQTAYSPTPTNPEPAWLAGFQPLVVTAPAPSGLVLFALGFGILGLYYCRKQRSDSLHRFVAA